MNSHSKSQRIAFIALLVAAIVLIAGGAFGVVNRTSASGEQMLSDMRLTALLTTAGEGSKEALVEAESRGRPRSGQGRRRRTCPRSAKPWPRPRPKPPSAWPT